MVLEVLRALFSVCGVDVRERILVVERDVVLGTKFVVAGTDLLNLAFVADIDEVCGIFCENDVVSDVLLALVICLELLVSPYVMDEVVARTEEVVSKMELIVDGNILF